MKRQSRPVAIKGVICIQEGANNTGYLEINVRKVVQPGMTHLFFKSQSFLILKHILVCVSLK